MVNRFEVYLLNIDEVVTEDAKNTRPCVVLSPDEINHNIGHVLVAPISSGNAKYPTRIPVDLLNNERAIILDQIRAVDIQRLVKKIGMLDAASAGRALERLQEMFAE